MHSLAALNRLKYLQLINNVTLFPHGVNLPDPQDDKKQLGLKQHIGLGRKRIIASYGFLLPHKGITHLIHAFADLLSDFDDIHLLLVNASYPAPESEAERELCKKLIAERMIQSKVTMINDFLPDEQSLALLGLAECIVFPYQDTQESASGAIKQGLAAGRPILCSPLAIFDDVADAVLFLPGVKINQIRQGIAGFLRQPEQLHLQIDRQQKWCQAHHWPLLAQRLWNMIISIEAQP